MGRQHAAPLIISPDQFSISKVMPLGLRVGDGMTEASIHELIHRHLSCLPMAEIDPLFAVRSRFAEN